MEEAGDLDLEAVGIARQRLGRRPLSALALCNERMIASLAASIFSMALTVKGPAPLK
jgi:hypothetical protein